MEKIRLSVLKDDKEKVIYDYLSFGYRLIDEKENDKRVTLKFIRKLPNPLLKALKWVEKEYCRVQSSTSLARVVIPLIISILLALVGTFGLLFFFLFTHVFPSFVVIPDWARYTIVVVSYNFAALFLGVFFIALSSHHDAKKYKDYYLRDITETGYALIRQRIILPEDEYIQRDGTHYHYIYNYLKDKK